MEAFAEILYTLVPLTRDVGLDAEWAVMFGRSRSLTSPRTSTTPCRGTVRVEHREPGLYEEYNRQSAAALVEASEHWDVVFVHDPQPALLKHFSDGLSPETKWVWRCHIDTSTPNREVLDYLSPYVRDYDAQVYTMREYTPPDLDLPGLVIIPPAIDPLSPKNMALSADDARYITNQFGIDADRPFLVQVSRFDPWKDPLGS